jgi:hypothetical protein
MDEIVRDVNDSWVDSPEQEWGGDEAVGRVGGGESMGLVFSHRVTVMIGKTDGLR